MYVVYFEQIQITTSAGVRAHHHARTHKYQCPAKQRSMDHENIESVGGISRRRCCAEAKPAGRSREF